MWLKIKRGCLTVLGSIWWFLWFVCTTIFIWWFLWKLTRPALRSPKNPLYWLYTKTVGRWRWRPDSQRLAWGKDWVTTQYRRDSLGHLRLFYASVHYLNIDDKVHRWELIHDCFPMLGTYFVKSMDRHLCAGRGVLLPGDLPGSLYKVPKVFFECFSTWCVNDEVSKKTTKLFNKLLVQNVTGFQKFISLEVESGAVVVDVIDFILKNDSNNHVYVVPESGGIETLGEFSAHLEDITAWYSIHRHWKDSLGGGKIFLDIPSFGEDVQYPDYMEYLARFTFDDEVFVVYYKKEITKVRGTKPHEEFIEVTSDDTSNPAIGEATRPNY